MTVQILSGVDAFLLNVLLSSDEMLLLLFRMAYNPTRVFFCVLMCIAKLVLGIQNFILFLLHTPFGF